MNVRALLRQRCPRCLEGRVFASLLRSHRECPACGADFEREQGYTLGAMYFSYGFGILVIAPPIVWMIAARVDPGIVIGTALAMLVVLSPLIFRASRVAWLHFDHRFDPLPDRERPGSAHGSSAPRP